MKTNAGGVRTLAVAALLALLGGARAWAGDWWSGVCPRHITSKITPNIVQRENGVYFITYGEDIVLHCSGENATQLEMKEGSNFLQVTKINTTTVQFFVKKPKVADLYRYTCMDNDVGCKLILGVEVRPAIFVPSSRAHYKQIRDVDTYFVPLGADYEVYCSSDDSANLMIISDGRLLTDVVNETLIKYATQANRVETVRYWCRKRTSRTGGSDKIRVEVDYNPEYHNFSCVLYDNRLLECSWNYSSDSITTYELFYTNLTEGYEDTTLLCSETSDKVTSACKVDMSTKRIVFWESRDNSFLLKSCNTFFCNNKTIYINTDVITKLDPVYNFEVLNPLAYGVSLQWIHNFKNLAYKVEYRRPALDDDWRQTDSSSILCHDTHDDLRCQYELGLLCPDAEYDVRVSVRHKEATDNRVWSDPASLRVTTAGVEECACSAAPDAPEMVLCKLCKLREDMFKDNLILKHKINSSLKKKRADFKRISELLPASIEVRKILEQYGYNI